MEDRSVRVGMLVLSVLVIVGGFVLLWFAGGWQFVVGLALVVWGNNMTERIWAWRSFGVPREVHTFHTEMRTPDKLLDEIQRAAARRARHRPPPGLGV